MLFYSFYFIDIVIYPKVRRRYSSSIFSLKVSLFFHLGLQFNWNWFFMYNIRQESRFIFPVKIFIWSSINSGNYCIKWEDYRSRFVSVQVGLPLYSFSSVYSFNSYFNTINYKKLEINLYNIQCKSFNFVVPHKISLLFLLSHMNLRFILSAFSGERKKYSKNFILNCFGSINQF